MTPQIAVTGVGLITPGGADEHTTWARLCEGRPTARRMDELAGLPVDFGCPVDAVDVDAAAGGRRTWRMHRFAKLALIAARQAVADAGLDPEVWDGTRVGVVVGVGVGGVSALTENARKLDGRDGGGRGFGGGARAGSGGADRGGADGGAARERCARSVSPLLVPMMIPNAAAGEVAIALHARGPSVAPATACASGATAIATARDLLATGQCDVVVAGGAEAVLEPLVVTGFAQLGAVSRRAGDPAAASRPFAADRDGFVLAEGAGVLVLEREADAAARKRVPRALLDGAASTTDAHHPTAPDPSGRGAREAVRAALRDAGWGAGDVEHVNTHGTSTPLNDAMEAELIGDLLPHRPPVTSVKGVLGHALAAAGAIEAAAVVLTLQHGVIPPVGNLDAPDPAFDLDCVVKRPRTLPVRTALSHSFGFGGHNVVLAFRRNGGG